MEKQSNKKKKNKYAEDEVERMTTGGKILITVLILAAMFIIYKMGYAEETINWVVACCEWVIVLIGGVFAIIRAIIDAAGLLGAMVIFGVIIVLVIAVKYKS